ncbi:ankyrin, partial [Hypoxylon sp. EC38]
DKPDKMGQFPIHLAAERGHVDIVVALLERRVSPNRVNRNGQTPLHRAAWGGSLQTIQLLLEKGSNPAVRDKFRNLAVHTAASLGYQDVLRRLCREVDVSSKGRNGLTPLHYAAMNGH